MAEAGGDDSANPGAAGGGPDLPFPDVPARSGSPADLLKVPCLVQRLIVRGNQRTKRALIDAEMAAAMKATTHEQLAVELAMATERLDQLDIFKSAGCSVDITSVPDAPENALDVVLNLEERGTHTISTGTYMQGGEGNAEVSWTLRNLFGNGERVLGNASLGHKTSNTFRLESSAPLAFGSPVRLNIAAFQSNANLTKYIARSQKSLYIVTLNIGNCSRNAALEHLKFTQLVP